MSTMTIDMYRQLLAAVVIQSGGEFRIKQSALNAERAGMELIQGVDEATGDLVLQIEYLKQEATR